MKPSPRPTTPLSRVIDAIRQQLAADTEHPVIVTISGPSGSGKSTLLEKLRTQFGPICTTISTDSYYIGRSAMSQTMPAGHSDDFDHPNAIDTAHLVRDIDSLQAGTSVDIPRYDMLTSEPTGETDLVAPSPLIIIEGLAANLPEIRRHSSLSIALIVPLEERIRRRVARDITRKGYSPEHTRELFMTQIEPGYQAYYASHDAQVEYQVKT